jgi:hypothetical protein
MGMQEPLDELMGHLQAALAEAETGAGDPDELRRLVAEVDRRLNEDDSEGVVDDLRHEVTKFEASHPRLADAIGRAADALSSIGL